MLTTEFRDAFAPLVESAHKVLFLGIGENRMGDDGFGQYVVHHMRHHPTLTPTKKSVKIVNGKTNYIERKQEICAFHPDLLCIIDTCKPRTETQLSPGALLVKTEHEFVNWLPLSSHVLPIPVFITEVKMSIPDLKSILIGIIPYSTEYTQEVLQYRSNFYSLDDYEKDPDLPFYDFNLTPMIQKVADELVNYLLGIL